MCLHIVQVVSGDATCFKAERVATEAGTVPRRYCRGERRERLELRLNSLGEVKRLCEEHVAAGSALIVNLTG